MPTVEARKLSASQRNTIIGMLGSGSDARRKAKSEYRALYEQMRESFVKAKAKEPKVAELVKKTIDLRTQLDEAEDALGVLGLEVEGNEVKLRWRAEGIRREIDEKIEQKIGAEVDVDRKFDKAIARVLKAETAEEAAEVVESMI